MKEIKKISPLSESDICVAKSAYDTWTTSEAMIMNRTDYIIRKTAEIFGGKIEWWDWKNGGGEVDGHFEIDWIKDESIDVDGETKGGGDWVAILKDGEWELGLTFPTRWLTEDFEEELVNGIEKYKEKFKIKEEAKKKAAETKKQKKQSLVESAKKKLTPEEKRALGL